MKTIHTICAIVAAIFVVSNATKVEKCKDERATALPTVDFQDCDGKKRCVLYRGQEYDFSVKFKAAANVDTVKVMPIGSAFFQEATFRSGNDDDACKSITKKDKKGGAPCPIKKGTQYIYSKPIQIAKDEPQLKLTPEWRFVDATNKTVACFKLQIQTAEKS